MALSILALLAASAFCRANDIHAGGFNLGLVMRHLIGVGTPRGLQGRFAAMIAALLAVCSRVNGPWTFARSRPSDPQRSFTPSHRYALLPAVV
jgi:transposase